MFNIEGTRVKMGVRVGMWVMGVGDEEGDGKG